MTLNDYMEKYSIKKHRLTEWIKKGLIPGADIINNYIPDSARKPYTCTRAKKPKAIYKSILKATDQGQHVLPAIFKICQDEFDGYIKRLEEAGKIIVRTTDNIEYYDLPMPQGVNLEVVESFVEAHSRGISEGTTTALLKAANS